MVALQGCGITASPLVKRGTTVRSLTVARLGAPLAGAVFLALSVPEMARAAMLKCASHSLNRDDASRLKVAARVTLPKSVRVLVEGACLNPGRAIGFIETQKVFTKEGVRQWWTMICRRDADDWSCDPPEFEQTIGISVKMDGQSREVELSIGKNVPLELGRALASRSIEIYADRDSRLPSCGGSQSNEKDQLRSKYNHQSFPSIGKLHASVEDDSKRSVTLDDVGVTIDFRSPAYGPSLEAACWWDVIIVD